MIDPDRFTDEGAGAENRIADIPLIDDIAEGAAATEDLVDIGNGKAAFAKAAVKIDHPDMGDPGLLADRLAGRLLTR
jgi:hypothetical protein